MTATERPASTQRAAPPAGTPAGAGFAFAPVPLGPLGDRPLVSVLVANFNYARYLPAALDSLLAQTYPHWHAVVCDDGSTDGSADVVRAYARRDARVELVAQPNAGQRAACNAAQARARGEVQCFLDSDDAFLPDKIEAVVDRFRSSPEAGLCGHFCQVVDADDRPLTPRMPHHLDEGWLAPDAGGRGACVRVPTTSALSFRRAVLSRLMPVPEALRRDVDGYLGMAAQYLTPLVAIHRSLSRYRVHGTNMGGLTVPTPERLSHELTLIEERTAVLRAFLDDLAGPEAAARLSVRDNPQYLQAALKLRAVAGPAAAAGLPPPADLIARHPSASWRRIWRAIFALPGPVRRRGVPLMHNCTAVKSFVQRRLLKPPPEPA